MADTMKPTLPLEEWFSHETVQRLIDETYAAGLEDAAKVCDSVNNYSNPMTANDCADEIRSMKPNTEDQRAP
jgi:hypothetical protein